MSPYVDSNHRGVSPQGRGNFPGFDVLAEVDQWDVVTAGVVLARLALPEHLAFFTPHEAGVAGPLLDLLLAQDGDPRVPVLALIDERLARGETDGWHYDELPEDGDAWRDSLRHLDEDAVAEYELDFAHLDHSAQASVVAAVQQRAADDKQWRGVPAKHIWSLWTRFACTAFYSHPWAWNEIGFPGPAYPRGYLNLGGREHWEVAEAREQ
ncbi:MAG TPA: gluconate 2-dehydrogenase subunit 3 family protein [Jatrophihabitantaceae bacterium]|nr:gluconate 2-dehydrogenase subunit 3 family protein [Jatrophihabitantaceae bacterium]